MLGGLMQLGYVGYIPWLEVGGLINSNNYYYTV